MNSQDRTQLVEALQKVCTICSSSTRRTILKALRPDELVQYLVDKTEFPNLSPREQELFLLLLERLSQTDRERLTRWLVAYALMP